MRDISLETIIAALTYIDAHDRDIWLKVGNALKTEFGEIAFAVFDNWSQTADNYDAKAVKRTWNSYTLGKVTIGTVRYLAEQSGFDFNKYESKPIDPKEQEQRQAKRQQAEREAEALEQAEKVAWAKLLPQIGQAANNALSTPFTHDKGISTTGISSIHCNELHAFKHPLNTYNGKPESIGYALKGLVTLVPYRDLKTGELVKLQGISGIKATTGKEAGKYIKRPIGKGDGYYWRGDILKQDTPKVIVEGFSDAQTIYEYTEQHHASLAAGNDTALMKAALALRALCPSAVIIVFGDNDLHGRGQRLAEAAALAINGICLFAPSQYKDANEWVLAEGSEGLNKMIDAAIEKMVTERSRSEKAVPPSEDGTAPNSDNVASESIADGLGGGDGQESEDAAIERLSFLSAIEYERVRVDEAKKLNIRATVLDKLIAAKRKEQQQSQDKQEAGTSAIFEEVNVWPYAVDGALLLHDITNIVQRFTVLSDEQARACALWIAFTWFIDGAKVAPMINITSPEKRCGKSTLLLVIESMVSKPILASNISGAALFRSIELWTPTLLIDETDAFLNEKEELRGMLNAGHYRKTAFVIRTVGDSHEPKKFMTWCAKVLCGIGKIAHTLTDRSIVIELRRKLATEKVENIHLANEDELSVIRQKLKRWYQDSFEQYREARPKRIEGINDRAADNWQPLQSIAELAGKDWPNLCRLAAIQLAGIEEEAPSINVELLMDIADIFHDKSTTKIFTLDLIEALCQDEEKAWATWNRGKNITPHQVSKKLAEFKIKPDDVRIGAIHKKGYKLQDINEALIRYKPTPDESATPRQPSNSNAYSDFNKRDTTNNVADRKPLEPLINKDCRGVADTSDMAIDESTIGEV